MGETDLPVRQSRWFAQRLFVMGWTVMLFAFGMRLLDGELISQEWMVRLVLYSLLIVTVGDGAGAIATQYFSRPDQDRRGA